MLYLAAMRSYVTFDGRASRAEFGEFLGGWFLLTLGALGLDKQLAGEDGGSGGLIVGLVTLVHLLPFLAITARRFHDLDRSGWLALIALVPILGLTVFLIGFMPGIPGPNRYGAEPSRSRRPSRGGNQAAGRLSETSAPNIGAPASTGSPRTSAEAVSAIERLVKLRDNGAITNQEFAEMKARALGPNGQG